MKDIRQLRAAESLALREPEGDETPRPGRWSRRLREEGEGYDERRAEARFYVTETPAKKEQDLWELDT